MTPILAALLLVQAQQPCGPTGQVEKRIHDQYGESIVGAGVVDGGTMFLTANPDSGTFTIMLRRKDGMTCVLMGGKGFATLDAVKKGQGI
jgi:hypothetical protein